MPKYTVIVNPVSGRGTGSRIIPQIEQLLTMHQLDYQILRTERPWHASELAQQAVKEGSQVIVAAGGDGTCNEVLNGLVLAAQAGFNHTKMGVLPIGGGNDFAFSMGVPIPLEESCQALALGHSRVIDVGHVRGGLYPQGRYFGNGVGIGFDAVVGFEALKMPQLKGFISYLVAALKTIFLYFKAPMLKIELDNQTLEQSSIMVSIMNGRRMGGGFWMAPQGIGDDGFFDLCIARGMSRTGIVMLIPRFMKGTQAGHPAITTTQSRQVKVTAVNGTLPAHADGETLCVDGSELTITMLPRQVELIVFKNGHTP